MVTCSNTWVEEEEHEEETAAAASASEEEGEEKAAAEERAQPQREAAKDHCPKRRFRCSGHRLERSCLPRRFTPQACEESA